MIDAVPNICQTVGVSCNNTHAMSTAITGWRFENIAVRVKTDVHAPIFLRAVGPMSNLTPFYEAYGVRPGDRMYRADSVRVKIW